MLVSCWSRSPVDSTVSRMRWGPLAIALAALLAGAPRSAGAAIHALSSDPRLVGGLTIGENTLSVSGRGVQADSLVLTNYPITGPITSGPHIKPFICQTQEFVLPDGTKLGPPLDADCSAPTVIQYLYLPIGANALIPMPSTSRLPDDVSKTTTLSGLTVSFVSTRTINRGVYQSAILH